MERGGTTLRTFQSPSEVSPSGAFPWKSWNVLLLSLQAATTALYHWAESVFMASCAVDMVNLPHFRGHLVSGDQAAWRSGARATSPSRLSNSAGVWYFRLECLRWRLYHTSMNSKMAPLASLRVCQSSSWMSSISTVAKKLSATALSQQLPFRLMLATTFFPSSNAR